MSEPAARGRGPGQAAPWLSLAFIAGCLATIPYGAPVGGWVPWALAALGVAAVLAARLDGAGRWSGVRVWPVAACLAATGIAIAASAAPGVSLERSASMVLFSLLAIVAQVALWDARAARGVAFAAAGAMAAVSLDVAWQRVTGVSLWLREPGAGPRWSGSQGNLNDMAVAPLLLPLALAAVAPGAGAWRWRAALAAVAVPAWWLSASRQAFGAWALASATMVRRSRRSLAVAAALATVLAVAIAVVPTFRARATETMNSGLGVREDLLAFGASLVRDHPATGIGPGLFGAHYKKAALEGWTYRGRELPQVGMPWVHCLPLEVACEYGAVGVAAFGAAVVAALRAGFRAGRDPGEVDAARRVSRGAAVALVLLLLVGLVDLSFIKDWVRCAWWLVLGLALGGTSPEKSGTRGPVA